MIGIRGCLGLAFCWALGVALDAAPEPSPSIRNALTSAWKTEQGLPENAVECLLQTRDGWLWVGTREGLARFDGARFTVYNGQTAGFTSDAILNLAEDGEAALWVATKRGAYRLRDGVFQQFRQLEGLLADHVYAVAPARDGGMWFATKGGLNHHLSGAITSFPFSTRLQSADEGPEPRTFEDRQVYCVLEDASGQVVVGTSDGAWSLHRSTREFRPIWIPDPNRLAIAANCVRSIAVDREGAFWFGTDKAIVRWKGQELGRWQAPDLESDSRLRRILIEPSGAVCVVQAGGIFRIVENRIEEFDPSKELSDLYATDLMRDREGNLWLATRYGGLRRLRWPRAQTLTTRNGLPSNNIYSVFEEADGTVLISTGNGVCEYKDDVIRRLFSPSEFSRRGYRTAIRDSFGSYWLGDTAGPVRWLLPDATTIMHFRPLPTFSDYPANVIFQDIRTNIWIGTGGAILRYVPKKGPVWGDHEGLIVEADLGEQWRYRADRNECLSIFGSWIYWRSAGGTWRGIVNGETVWCSPEDLARRGLTYLNEGNLHGQLASYDVRAIHEDHDGTLWFGTQGGGLGRLRDQTFTTFGGAHGLADANVRALYEDGNGALWVGTRAGLSRWQGGRFFNFTQAHGLPEMSVNQILEDDQAMLWLGGSRGVFRVSRESLDLLALGKTTTVSGLHLAESDGMLNLDTNGGGQPSGCKTRDGLLWFCTSQGLVRIDPRRVEKSTNAPPVFVEDLLVNGKAVPIRPELQLLPAGSGARIEIHFTALCLTAPERVRFQIRLDGLEESWAEIGTRRTAYYTNLKPGEYRFRVRAANHDGVWNEQGATLAFAIAPYFYQTPWFYAVMVVGFLLLAATIHFWRLRRIESVLALRGQLSVEKERFRLARDLHDGLGAGISQIELFAGNAKHELPEHDRACAWLDRISAANERIRQSMEDLQWTANPTFDSLRSLVIRLRRDARDYLEPAGIEVHFSFPEDGLDQPMSSAARHYFLMAQREILHNVARHAAASQVRIVGEISGALFRLSIVDNGRGFDFTECLGNGNGLTNLQSRALEIAGEFAIQSQPGETRVEIAARFSPPSNAIARP